MPIPVLVQRVFMPQSGSMIAKSTHPNGLCKRAGRGHPSYIGTKLLYKQGGYESTRSCVAPEGDEVLVGAMRELLGVSK